MLGPFFEAMLDHIDPLFLHVKLVSLDEDMCNNFSFANSVHQNWLKMQDLTRFFIIFILIILLC